MVAAAQIGVAAVGAFSANRAASKGAASADKAGERTLTAAREAEALNRERYGDAQGYLNPYLERELQASNQLLTELGLAQYEGPTQSQGQGGPTPYLTSPSGQPYITTPSGASIGVSPGAFNAGSESDYLPVRNIQSQGAGGYRRAPGYAEAFDALDALEDEGIETVNQGAVNSGTLYSGRRGEELRDLGANTQLARAQTQNQFYNNYINTLQNLANPSATTNLSSLGVGQAANIGNQNIAATNAANQNFLTGAATRSAGTADVVGGLTNAFGAYIGSQGNNQASFPSTGPTTGTGGQFPSSAYI